MPDSLIRKVVFPVAGLGTRFLPATKAVPKEMLPVVDRPLIQWAVEEASAAGCEEFIFVTSREKPSILAHFSQAEHYENALKAKDKLDLMQSLKAGLPANAKVHEVFQDEPLGLGHAIWCARDIVGEEPFAVILPDDMVLAQTGCLSQMVEAHAQLGGNLVAVENVPADQTSRYGVVDPISDDGTIVAIKGLVEKPKPEDAPSTLAIIGRYILDPSVMRSLDQGKTGAGGEIQVTDALADLIGTTDLSGYRFSGIRYDCGSRDGFLAANIAFAVSPFGADMGDELRQKLSHVLEIS